MNLQPTQPASSVLPGVILKRPIDYTSLDIKWDFDYHYSKNYKYGQQCRLETEDALDLLKTIVNEGFSEMKNQTQDPNAKITIDNHMKIIDSVIKSLNDHQFSFDFKRVLAITDGITYANGKQFYKKEY